MLRGAFFASQQSIGGTNYFTLLLTAYLHAVGNVTKLGTSVLKRQSNR